MFLALTAGAFAEGPAVVSGTIHDREGAPLMGAIVELFGPHNAPIGTAFTDTHGQYIFTHLHPGRYRVYVAQAFYLPVHRSNILVHTGSSAIVNLTMTTLFDAAEWFPAKPRPANEPEDDWSWTLRSAANRPILRWDDDAPYSVHRQTASTDQTPTDPQSTDADNSNTDTPRLHLPGTRRIHVNLAVVTGSRQFGQGGVRQQTFVRMDEGSNGESVYRMQVAPSGGATEALVGFERDPTPGTVLRTSASYQSLPVVATGGQGHLQSMQLRSADQMEFGDLLMAQFGADAAFVQAAQSVAAVQPFIAINLHGNHGTQVSYRLATAVDMQSMEDSAPAFTSVPQVAEQNGALRMTRALHQELALERQIRGAQIEAAVFFDRMIDPVLSGYGSLSASEFASGNVMMDPVTGAFRSIGPNYSGSGVRVFASRQLKNTLWTAFEYTDGPAVVMPVTSNASGSSIGAALAGMEAGRAQSVYVSMRGKVSGTGTAWTAGYRWQPTQALTPVDAFNTGANNPFLSFTIRQPLPYSDASPDRLVLMIEMQNILAQGYSPVYVLDGNGVYFAQTARTLTGGLAFSF